MNNGKATNIIEIPIDTTLTWDACNGTLNLDDGERLMYSDYIDSAKDIGLIQEIDEPEFLRREEEILDNVKSILARRQEEYGDPKSSLGNIALYWSVYLNRELTAYDVANLMALLKMARLSTESKNNTDSSDDAIGYLVLGQRLIDEQS